MSDRYEWRAAGAFLLAGIAGTHAADLSDKLEEAPHVAALFIANIAASVLLAALLLAGRQVQRVWAAAGALAGATLVCYVLSRSVPLPELEDHVGMWFEPAGIASLVFEGATVVLAFRWATR